MFAGAFEATLHSFYTVPAFTWPHMLRCASASADVLRLGISRTVVPRRGPGDNVVVSAWEIPATVGRFGHSARQSGSRDILMGCQKFELSGLTPSLVGKSLGR